MIVIYLKSYKVNIINIRVFDTSRIPIMGTQDKRDRLLQKRWPASFYRPLAIKEQKMIK